MSIAQIIENGVVVNVIAVDPAAVVSSDGKKLTWGESEFDAPEGATFMMQLGAGIGWALSAGVLAAPSAAAPTIEQLAAAVASGAAASAASITNQIAPDATHQNAYLNAAAMVWGAGGAAPASGPAEAVFAAYAAQFAVAPAVLAARVVAGSIAAMELSGALGTLQGAVAEVADATHLTTALAAFETAISGIVANLTAAGLSVTAPATISVPGVNA